MKVLIFVLFMTKVATCLRCYSGSGMRKADVLPLDDSMAAVDDSEYWNQWFYRTIVDNCMSCSRVVVTQDPGSSYRTHPTVIVQLICDKPSLDIQCSIDETKYQSDLDTVINLNPQSKSQEFLNEMRRFCEPAPKLLLASARKDCATCDSDGCNTFDFQRDVACTTGYGLQSKYSQQCSTGQSCYVERNKTSSGQINSQYKCQSTCSLQQLSSCLNACKAVDSNTHCLCWCDHNYLREGSNSNGSPPNFKHTTPFIFSFAAILVCQMFFGL